MQVKFAFNLSRVYEHYQRKNFAIISAYRSDLTHTVNEQRAKALKREVRNLGYGYQEIRGYWKEQLGEEAGNVAIEYPLFIPNIKYEDALTLGRGDWPGGNNVSQYSIIWADGTVVMELRVDIDPPQPLRQFSRFLANKPDTKDLKGDNPEEISQKADELAKLWQGYSEHRGRPWAYVAWVMGEPPRADAPDFKERRAAQYWDDNNEYPFYHRAERSYLMYQGAVYQELPGGRTTSLRVGLPKQVVALLRGRFKRPSFSNELNVPNRLLDLWDIDPNDILSSTKRFSGDLPIRFSWHPTSGEFLLSMPSELHAHTIKSYGSHPFDEYVRGLVLRDQNIIATRPWAPDFGFGMSTGDPEENRAQQYLAEQASAASQEACKRVLTTVGGVPTTWKWRFDVSNADLQDLTGVFRW